MNAFQALKKRYWIIVEKEFVKKYETACSHQNTVLWYLLSIVVAKPVQIIRIEFNEYHWSGSVAMVSVSGGEMNPSIEKHSINTESPEIIWWVSQ